MSTARRFVGLAVLLFFALPFGLSVIGCGNKNAPVQFCTAGDSGPVVGQVASIILSPGLATTGESLNYGQIGQALSASAVDCKGNPVTIKNIVYSSTSSFNENVSGGAIVADINPSNGTVCGGTWNRNSSGGIAPFTTCTPPSPAPPVSTPVPVSVPASLPAPSTVSLGASPFAYTATAAGLLSVQNATVSSITTTINNTITTVSSSAPLFVIPTEIVTITYTASTTTPPPTPTLLFTPAYAYSASAPGALQIIGGAVSAIYDYVAASGSATLVPSISNIVPMQAGDVVGIFYTKAPTTVLFIPNGVAALVTATASGAVSNAIPVFVHPLATGVILSGATPNCSTDPGTDCCPNDTTGTPVVAPVYTASACLSQNQIGQLVARIYQGGIIDAANNITCQIGHVTFAAQTPGVVSIDQNGAATAEQPGSSVITATISQSSTAAQAQAGFFSTCPPASIQLSIPGQPAGTTSIPVNINNLQPLTATVTDTLGNPITGLALEFNSTTPQTIPAVVGSVTPLFPGSADITAVCQPATCNTAPSSQIGLFGNGKAITSNPITINAIGTSSTVLYMASTDSQYVAFRDFTTTQPSALIKLPYQPNSMVMNQAGTAIYFGSIQGLMSISIPTNALGAVAQGIPGTVLSVSPDGSTVVVTDPTRQTISLIATSSDAVITSYGGIGTSASWSPDDQAVYITTTTGAVLTHSAFTDWQTATADEVYTDVTVTVPSVGAFFAGPSTTDARSYCPASITTGSTTVGSPATVTNQYIPLVDQSAAITDQIAATTNGKHILGAHSIPGGTSTLSDILVTLPPNSSNPNQYCPIPGGPFPQPAPGYFQSTFTTKPLTGIVATPIPGATSAITGVVPASNSAAAFVTYTGASGLLPLYFPSATGNGTLQFLTLGNGATAASAPVAGVFSTDNFSFYVGTSSDNQVHIISLTYPTGGTPTATETPGTVLTPNLPALSGSGYATVNLIAQHPKKSTS
jgi:trimeric autotransporter adhesin